MKKVVSVKSWGLKTVLFLLFLAVGLLIFVVFSHFRPLLPGMKDRTGRLILVLGFLSMALLVRGIPRLAKYWRIPFAFFIAALVTAIDLYLPSRVWLLNTLKVPLQTPAGIALDKLDSSLVIILGILLLNFVSGGRFSDLYLQKGNLKQGLTVGLIAFAGRASVLCPLTPDFGFFRLILDGASPTSVGRGGTRLEEPLHDRDRSRAVEVVVGDGDDHEARRDDDQPEGGRQPHAERLVVQRLIAVAQHRHAAQQR